MNQRYFRHHNRELGIAWFVIPLLAACAALLGLLLIAGPSSFADELQAQPGAGTAPFYLSSDPSVPAAGSVFTDTPPYVPGLAVETF